jgi:NADPH:quinone reductase-like Zn-dependent oxidoreductase/acyl carrier protein
LPEGRDAAAFQLFSRERDDEPWVCHGSGTLRRAASDSAPSPEPLASIRSRCTSRLETADYYASMRAEGHDYGPAFQALREIWLSSGEAVARIELSDVDAAEASRYTAHPVLLDASLQLLGAAMPERAGHDGRTYLPVSLERLTVRQRGLSRTWCHVRVRPVEGAPDTVAGDIVIFTDDGSVVATIDGIYMKPATADALSGRTAPDWVHEIAWRQKPAEAAATVAGRWIVLTDDRGVGMALADRIRQEGRTCQVITRAACAADGTFDPAALDGALRAAATHGSVAGVVHLWALDAEAPGEAATVMPGARGGCAELLHVVQSIVNQHEIDRPRLLIVTRGAQCVGSAAPAFEQAALLGLARTIGAEYPDLRCTAVDIDTGTTAAGVDSLVREIGIDDREDVIAWRGEARLVPRLTRTSLASSSGASIALEIGTRGVLDTLRVAPAPRSAPGPGEVEVQVRAAGLNFRDVLNALGMYEGPAGALGSECVGVVTRVGAGVTALATGDEVMGMAGGALRRYVCVNAEMLARRPAWLGVQDAATLPIVFLTALYGLVRLAGLARGERVLIHAGAGGVGLAAIQVARRAGAEVFATAGSEEKREYLRSLGVEHVFSSRTLTFADEIRAVTAGAGVNVVLNSLNGDFIAASMSVLSPNGRFVEIGKAGIWSQEQVAAARPDVRYLPLYLGDVPAAELRPCWDDLLGAIEGGELHPLPARAYPLSDAASAFRFMAQARHVGKLVVHVGAPATIREDGTYLVTGAFGGVGKRVSGWLVGQGARHLVLLGRHGADSPGGGALVQDLIARGANVRAAAVDVADDKAVAALFASLSDMPPVRGVFHAAGVLDDGVLATQTPERLATVFAPKVAGAWHLHQQTRSAPLDMFVMFSSMVTVLGGPGQGNYAAANAFLDALAHARRAAGLPGLTIDWGPWADAGMSAGVSELDHQRWKRQGLSFIKGPQGLAILRALLDDAPPRAAVLPIHWPTLLQQFPAGGEPPILTELAALAGTTSGRSAAAPALDLVEQLRQAAPARRRAVARGVVATMALRVLGLDAATPVDGGRPLQELGLDSLMAVELRNTLGASLQRTLPATLLFRHPTIDALVEHVLEICGHTEEAHAQAPAGCEDVVAIESLSDDEVKRLLAEELAALSSAEWMGEEGRDR